MLSTTSWKYSLCLLFLLLASACGDVPGAQVQPGHVSGAVFDAAGEPLEGAFVTITGTTFAGGENAEFDTTTGPDGTYSVKVPDGRWGAKAWVEREFEGRLFSRLLHPRNGNPHAQVDSTEGGTLDFEWRLSGLSAYSTPPGTTYTDFYGASLDMSYCGLPADAYCDSRYTELTPNALPGGSTVTFTLTPTSSLIDGRAAEPVTFEIVVADIRQDYPSPTGGGRLVLGEDWEYQSQELHDIPLATYMLSAEGTAPDGTTRALKLGLTEDDVEHDSVPIAFEPWEDYNARSYTGGGINLLEVHVRD